jgi:hypothetical protein
MEATLSRFAQEHFGGAALGDSRRTKRLVKVADRIVSHPGGTLPAKMGTPADLKALYRLVDRDAVTHAAVIETHRQLTLSRMRECKRVVLLIHDTTQLDFTGKHSLKNLGQAGHRAGKPDPAHAAQGAPQGAPQEAERTLGPREPAMEAGQRCGRPAAAGMHVGGHLRPGRGFV